MITVILDDKELNGFEQQLPIYRPFCNIFI